MRHLWLLLLPPLGCSTSTGTFDAGHDALCYAPLDGGVLQMGLVSPVPGCSRPQAATGVIDLADAGWSLQGGVLVVPPSAPGTPLPVVFGFHGAYSSGETVRARFGLEGPADGGAIFIYPNAVQGTWDVGPSSLDGRRVDALLSRLAQSYCIDPARISIAGFSAGAVFTLFLGCNVPTPFHAMAVVAGTNDRNDTRCAEAGDGDARGVDAVALGEPREERVDPAPIERARADVPRALDRVGVDEDGPAVGRPLDPRRRGSSPEAGAVEPEATGSGAAGGTDTALKRPAGVGEVDDPRRRLGPGAGLTRPICSTPPSGARRRARRALRRSSRRGGAPESGGSRSGQRMAARGTEPRTALLRAQITTAGAGRGAVRWASARRAGQDSGCPRSRAARPERLGDARCRRPTVVYRTPPTRGLGLPQREFGALGRKTAPRSGRQRQVARKTYARRSAPGHAGVSFSALEAHSRK